MILAALLAGTLAAGPVAAPASAPAPAQMTFGTAVGAVSAYHRVGSDRFCIRSGWTSATFATSRHVRRGDCRTGKAWRQRGIVFDTPGRN